MTKIFILIFLLSIFFTGCIDLDVEGEYGIIDTISVADKGQIAICLNKEGESILTDNTSEIYITNLDADSFKQITTDKNPNNAIKISSDGKSIVYVEKAEDNYKLYLYNDEKGSIISLTQEMYPIALPSFSKNEKYITYVIFPNEDSSIGNLNIYEEETSSIYTLTEGVHYDYEWIPGTQKVIVINVTEELENGIEGVLLIKDVRNFKEEIIFRGYFPKGKNIIGLADDAKTVIFNASDKESNKYDIFTFDIKRKNLSKWHGPYGYEFMLPSNEIKGYILAHVKGSDEEWMGQLYLVNIAGEIMEVPGYPIWLDRHHLVYLDLHGGAALILGRLTEYKTNLNENFKELYGQEED